VIPYNGSHGDAVYLMFINEGGYYYAKSGTGIGVAVAAAYDLQTGNFVQDECDPYNDEDCEDDSAYE
jgi:hypothetical protein